MNRICYLALVSVALLGSVVAESPDEALLQQLCTNQKAAPEIGRISQIRSMIGTLKDNPNIICPVEVRAAIESLEPLINLEDVCSAKATDAIVNYWSQFINSKQKKSTPPQLKRFFIGFGLQVSRTCKQALISRLGKIDTEKTITRDDFELVTREIQESGQIKALFGDDLELESLIILAPGVKKQAETEVLSLAPKEKKYFDLKRERCLNVFKPVYDALILPAVRLADIGLNYKGPSVAEELRALAKKPYFEIWVNVIFACEPVVKFQTIVAPVSKLDADGNQVMATVLDEEDIAEIKKNTGLTLEDLTISQPIDYKIGAKLSDQIIDETDVYLSKSIGQYKQGLKEVYKARIKLVKRFVPIIKFVHKNKLIHVGLKNTALKKTKRSKFGSSSDDETSSDYAIKSFFKMAVIATAIILLIVALSCPVGPGVWAAFGVLAAISVMIFINFLWKRGYLG